MFNRDQSDDYRPLFWVSGHPIYVNRLLLILNIAAFAMVAIAAAVVGDGVLDLLSLDNGQILHGGQIWRLFTYIVFPPDAYNAIRFIFAMGFLYFFGRQVEEYVGRTAFLYLYLALVLIPALLACVLGLFGIWINAWGSYGPIFGVFIAFAVLYPGMEINIWFVNLTAKYWAFILLAVLTLVDLRNPIGLGGLWLDAGIGYLTMRLIGAGYGMTWFTDWVETRRATRLAKKHNIRVLKETKATESIDEILDKISKQGVGSLTAKERAALERARANLLKRDER